MSRVRMIHPKLPGQDIHVPEQAVDGHLRTGWQVTEEPEPATPERDEPVETPSATDKPAATSRRFTTSPPSGKE